MHTSAIPDPIKAVLDGAAAASLRLGSFDLAPFGVAIHDMQEEEEQLAKTVVPLSDRLIRAGEYEEALRLSRKSSSRYARVRVHEKAHFYQHISCAAPLSRVFAMADSASYVFKSLEALDRRSAIWLPLELWAIRSKACPPVVREAIWWYFLTLWQHVALDGATVTQHFSDGEHLFRRPYSDITGNFWTNAEYTLGYRPLVEGAAKASEWIYLVRESPHRYEEALHDIRTSPAVYNEAFRYLVAALPGETTLAHLQALVVAADFALHPTLPDGVWPFVLTPSLDPKEASCLLPGRRFVRCIDLLRSRRRGVDLESKEDVGSHLTRHAANEYGWESPNDATKRALELVQGALFAHPPPSEPFGQYDPRKQMRAALQARENDPLAYVAPVNARLIQETGTQPSGFLGSRYNPLPITEKAFLGGEWYKQNLASRDRPVIDVSTRSRLGGNSRRPM